MARPMPQIILEEDEEDDTISVPSPVQNRQLSRSDTSPRSHSPSVLSQSSRNFAQPKIDDLEMGNMIQLGVLSEKQSRFGTSYKYLNRISMAEYTVTKWETNLSDEELLAVCNELDRMQGLHHPRIARFYGYHVSGKIVTMFRQFVPSGTVADLLKRGPLPEDTALKYFKQAMEGLQYLHDKGIVHGNVKAVNLLLTLSDDIQLADSWFGSVSQRLSQGFPCPDVHRRRTLFYAAPELLKDKKSLNKISAAADVWAMGCVLVTMVTRFPPFKDHFIRASTDEVHERLIAMHAGQSPYRSETLIPTASRQLADMVDCALEPSPALRMKPKQILERLADGRSNSVASTRYSSGSVNAGPSVAVPVTTAVQQNLNHSDFYYDPEPMENSTAEKQNLMKKAPLSSSSSSSSSSEDEEDVPLMDCCRWYTSRCIMFAVLLIKWIGMVLLAALSLAMVAGSVFLAIFVIYNGIGVVCQCQLNEGFIVLIALILLPIIILLTTLCCNNTCEKYKLAKEDGTMERNRYVSPHPEYDIVLCGVIVVQGKKEQRKQSVKRKNAGPEENDPTAASNLPKTAFVRGVASIA